MTFAQRGAALLDNIKPGWAQHINIASLDMNHPNDCVLGQLYGEYTGPLCVKIFGDVGGKQLLSLVFEHGFLCPSNKNLRQLRNEWITLIEERRNV